MSKRSVDDWLFERDLFVVHGMSQVCCLSLPESNET
jgi:hypothetical protein